MSFTTTAAERYVEAILATAAGKNGGAEAILTALSAKPSGSNTLGTLKAALERGLRNNRNNAEQIKKLQQRIDNAQDELDLAQREIAKLQR